MARTGGRQRSSGGARVEEESELFVRALARGLSVLALFDIEHPEWGLNEICEQTKISKTTAYRMLRTLEAKDFLAYDAVTEKYHLGKATIPMAYLSLSYVGFVRGAHPFLEELAAITGETVELSVAGPGGVDRGRPGGHQVSLQAQPAHRPHLEQPRSVGLAPAGGPHEPGRTRQGAQPAAVPHAVGRGDQPRRGDPPAGSRQGRRGLHRHRGTRPWRLRARRRLCSSATAV